MNEWPPRYDAKQLQKPCRTARKVAAHLARRKRAKDERDNKGAAKRRDKFACRFPLCGCRRLGLALEARLESSHDKHKGAGGNPAGDRSAQNMLITLCLHRHQDGAVSRHRGTLRTRYLTALKNDGPVAWEIHTSVIAIPTGAGVRAKRDGFVEVAREKAVQQLEPLAWWQREILEELASEMIA